MDKFNAQYDINKADNDFRERSEHLEANETNNKDKRIQDVEHARYCLSHIQRLHEENLIGNKDVFMWIDWVRSQVLGENYEIAQLKRRIEEVVKGHDKGMFLQLADEAEKSKDDELIKDIINIINKALDAEGNNK